MSRLIDADAVLAKIGEYADHPDERFVNDLAIAFDIICEAPTIELCEDSISREDALTVAYAYCPDDDGSCTKGDRDIRELLDDLEALPSVAPSRPSGVWIESFKSVEVKRGAYIGTKFIHDGWSCSECSEVVEKKYPNCPYCLARMKGADDE